MKKACNPQFVRVILLIFFVFVTTLPLLAQFEEPPPPPEDISSTDTIIKLTKQDSLEKEKEMKIIDSLILIDRARLAKETAQAEKRIDSLRTLLFKEMKASDKQPNWEERKHSFFNILAFIIALTGYYFVRKRSQI